MAENACNINFGGNNFEPKVEETKNKDFQSQIAKNKLFGINFQAVFSTNSLF